MFTPRQHLAWVVTEMGVGVGSGGRDSITSVNNVSQELSFWGINRSEADLPFAFIFTLFTPFHPLFPLLQGSQAMFCSCGEVGRL